MFHTELELFELVDGNGYQIPSHITVPYGKSLVSKLFIPAHNRATGTIRILPLVKYELPSSVKIKIHGNLLSRVNVPISNRASAIVNIVKKPTITLSLPPEKDAFVRESIPKLNYGSEQDMYVGYNTNYHEIYRSFVGFDISSLPTNAEIKGAYFKFYNELNNSPIQKVEIYELAADWTEKGITWDNQPKPTDKIGELEVGSAGGYLYADFTNIVREWYEGTKVNRGFVMKVMDETEIHYKRFYTRESNLAPSLEIEYYDKTVYTFDHITMACRVLIRQQSEKELNSRVNIKQVWFDEGIPSRVKVANMGTIDAHLVVKDPNLLSRIRVRQADNEDLLSKIVVRIKMERTFSAEVTVSRNFQFGKVRVRKSDARSILSKIIVRAKDQKSLVSSVTISKGFLHSRISVVKSYYLPSRVRIVGLD
ncbi:DNRLRE domain-containing protein, partial [Cellulosimicrobium cellulans]|uniref:DNRLRE domain-containing protein n=1 Tax=Cellulosimicrobium cellulans TaxID=1710 RepID=UPI0036E23DEF